MLARVARRLQPALDKQHHPCQHVPRAAKPAIAATNESFVTGCTMECRRVLLRKQKLGIGNNRGGLGRSGTGAIRRPGARHVQRTLADTRGQRAGRRGTRRVYVFRSPGARFAAVKLLR